MAGPVRFTVVQKQLEAAGWRLVRIRGAHHIFDRPGGPLVSVPVHRNHVKPFYVKQIKNIIAASQAGNPPRRQGQEPNGE